MAKAFECRMCGTCCYGEGGIHLEEREIDLIARFLGKPCETFLRESCEHRNGKVYIRCGDDGYCLFFDPQKLCLIHPVKPRPCRLWPFFPAIVADEDNWKAAQDACPGINPSCSFEDFVRRSGE